MLHKLPTSRSCSPDKVKKKKKGIKPAKIRKSLLDTHTQFYLKVNQLHAPSKLFTLQKSLLTEPKICMLHIFKNEERKKENFEVVFESDI